MKDKHFTWWREEVAEELALFSIISHVPPAFENGFLDH